MVHSTDSFRNKASECLNETFTNTDSQGYNDWLSLWASHWMVHSKHWLIQEQSIWVSKWSIQEHRFTGIKRLAFIMSESLNGAFKTLTYSGRKQELKHFWHFWAELNISFNWIKKCLNQKNVIQSNNKNSGRKLATSCSEMHSSGIIYLGGARIKTNW